MKTTFEHKYDLGVGVWFMQDNKPALGFVKDVICHYCLSKINDEFPYGQVQYVEYIVTTSDLHFKENQLFASKNELLNSLR